MVENYACGANEKDNAGWTVLHSAAETGNVELIRFLVERLGADPAAKDEWGRTPFSVAHFRSRDRDEVAQLLDGSAAPASAGGAPAAKGGLFSRLFGKKKKNG